GRPGRAADGGERDAVAGGGRPARLRAPPGLRPALRRAGALRLPPQRPPRRAEAGGQQPARLPAGRGEVLHSLYEPVRQASLRSTHPTQPNRQPSPAPHSPRLSGQTRRRRYATNTALAPRTASRNRRMAHETSGRAPAPDPILSLPAGRDRDGFLVLGLADGS